MGSCHPEGHAQSSRATPKTPRSLGRSQVFVCVCVQSITCAAQTSTPSAHPAGAAKSWHPGGIAHAHVSVMPGLHPQHGGRVAPPSFLEHGHCECRKVKVPLSDAQPGWGNVHKAGAPGVQLASRVDSGSVMVQPSTQQHSTKSARSANQDTLQEEPFAILKSPSWEWAPLERPADRQVWGTGWSSAQLEFLLQCPIGAAGAQLDWATRPFGGPLENCWPAPAQGLQGPPDPDPAPLRRRRKGPAHRAAVLITSIHYKKL